MCYIEIHTKGQKMKKPKTETLTIRLPESVKKDFEEKAAELQLSMAMITRKLVEDWVKQKHKQKKFDMEIPI